jgi:glucans biosynthesis protein
MKIPSRKSAFALAVLCLAALFGNAARAFDFDDLARKAQSQARRAYRPPTSQAPPELQALTYDEYRYIRFRPERSYWRSDHLPFELMFLHLGGEYQTLPVRLNEIVGNRVYYIPYDSADFYLERNTTLSPKRWGDIGFAGFRAHYALNTPDYKDELIAFSGASYFRALGVGQRYGMSARGLAIDTVGGQSEEFPRFTEFWLVKPAPDADTLTIYALLDSPRASGAYQFDVKPGVDTIVATRARLFLRANVATLGIAPLTSMYFFGENQPHRTDFRPEVHDSDGLMVAMGDGEWLWRPLINPQRTLATSFATRDPRGFGLMQRDRDFRSYEDGEARYDLRPSVWVEPVGSWGEGRVELVQLHTPDETNDNIVAYWVPAQQPAPGEPFDIAYRLHWQGGKEVQRPPGAWVVQTRVGRGYAELGPDEQQFIVDFTGPSLDALPADAMVEAVVTAPSNGRIIDSRAYRVEVTGAWRMAIRMQRVNPAEPTELRGFLQRGGDVLTETWSDIVPAL